jgi:hypothetical protein
LIPVAVSGTSESERRLLIDVHIEEDASYNDSSPGELEVDCCSSSIGGSEDDEVFIESHAVGAVCQEFEVVT